MISTIISTSHFEGTNKQTNKQTKTRGFWLCCFLGLAPGKDKVVPICQEKHPRNPGLKNQTSPGNHSTHVTILVQPCWALWRLKILDAGFLDLQRKTHTLTFLPFCNVGSTKTFRKQNFVPLTKMHKDAKSHSSHFHSSIRPVPKTRAASKSGIISCRKDEVWICRGASTYRPMNSRPLPLVETLPTWPGICKPGWNFDSNMLYLLMMYIHMFFTYTKPYKTNQNHPNKKCSCCIFQMDSLLPFFPTHLARMVPSPLFGYAHQSQNAAISYENIASPTRPCKLCNQSLATC